MTTIDWTVVELGAVIERIEAGASFQCDERRPDASEVGVVKVSAVSWGEYDEEESKTCVDPSRVNPALFIEAGDFLFSRANTVGLVGACVIARRVTRDVMLSDKILRLRFRDVVPAWVLHYLRSPAGRAELERVATGNQASMKNIGQERLRSLPLPRPPLEEQDRIVAAIEQNLSEIDAGVASLKRAQAKLKRYRASVLKAACEGRLVPTEAELARSEGRPHETGDVLLQRIRKERRVRWEADQRARMTARGQTPQGEAWKAKYEDPAGPDTSKLPSLPEGWVWTNMDALLAGIEAGASFKCDERPPTGAEVGVLKVSAVTWGIYDERESKTCTAPARIDGTLFVRPGDFLFSRANTIDLVGACVIAGSVSSSIMLSDKILRFRFAVVHPSWVRAVLRSTHGRAEIERLATGNQDSMRNIGQQRIREIVVPLPPLEEQHRMVDEIERLLSVADELEKTVALQLARAARLRQSVLKQAFEGKLVPQDPREQAAPASQPPPARASAAPPSRPRRPRPRARAEAP